MIEIKYLTKHVVPQLCQIMRDAHPWPWPEQIFAAFFQPDYRLTGAYLDQRLVGFCITRQKFNESHLLNICVTPCYQRQGIARALMHDYLSGISNNGQIYRFFLAVRESNFPAQNLYHECGFSVYKRQKNYYQYDNYQEHALFMSLELSD